MIQIRSCRRFGRSAAVYCVSGSSTRKSFGFRHQMARVRIAKLVIHLIVLTCLIMWMFQSRSVYRSSRLRKFEVTLSSAADSVDPVDIQLLFPPYDDRMLVRLQGMMQKLRSTSPVLKSHYRDERNLFSWPQTHNSDPGPRSPPGIGSPPGGGT